MDGRASDMVSPVVERHGPDSPTRTVRMHEPSGWHARLRGLMTSSKSGRSTPLHHLTREEACEALAITPELFAKLESRGGIGSDSEGRFDPVALASAALRYGFHQAETADIKLAAVGAALTDVKPALERLAVLADRAELSGDIHTKVMVEVAAFFSAFADVMNRATAALQVGEE